jgi:GxxExxY protein
MLITEGVIGAAIEVHRHLGAGLLENTYEMCLAKEFDLRSIRYERQKTCPLTYKGQELPDAYRIDFLVENQLVIEVKAVEQFSPLHVAQLLSYLKLLNCPIGLLLNFNVPILKDGIKRVSLPKSVNLPRETTFST